MKATINRNTILKKATKNVIEQHKRVIYGTHQIDPKIPTGGCAKRHLSNTKICPTLKQLNPAAIKNIMKNHVKCVWA